MTFRPKMMAFRPAPDPKNRDFDWDTQVGWLEPLDRAIEAARDRGDEREVVRLQAKHAYEEGHLRVHAALKRLLLNWPL